MPASPAASHTEKLPAPAPEADPNRLVRLHITPFTPALLNVYLAPSVLPLAKNISYHSIQTFPEKGFGYVELPAMEAQKIKKKLHGSTLKGSKVRVEDAKPEKRKAAEEGDVVDEQPAKRTKRVKAVKEQGVLEGVELPAGRKVKRGWTEPPSKKKKDSKEKKEKKDKTASKPRKESKYTKEPELLFNAKLTPVAAAEASRKDKSAKKAKKKSSSREVVIHEFEQNTKQPSFLKDTQLSTEAKPAVEYVNGKGWVDEDGNVVEAETGKARNRRVLELVDSVPSNPKKDTTAGAEHSPKSTSKPAKKSKKKAATPPSSSSESDGEESSQVSSSENDSSESDSDAEPAAKQSTPIAASSETPQMVVTPSSPDAKKEVHPLEALFKRPRPPTLPLPDSTTNPTPSKGLAPINTTFSFFEEGDTADPSDPTATAAPPATPFTQRDLEWRGLRSAAPTPDTAAIGRRFSFDWRKGSQEADDDNSDSDVDMEAGKQLSNNTKANASTSHLPGLAEEDESEHDHEGEEDSEDGAEKTNVTVSGKAKAEEGKEESEFGKWFWENRGDNNRAWKKRRRDTLKVKRLRENRKVTGGRKIG